MGLRLALVCVLSTVVAACQSGPTQEEIEAAKQSIDCTEDGQRLVIRFDQGEARLLMADGTRIYLYQIPVASGVRYSNGSMELRGKGTDLELVRLDQSVRLQCKPFELPAK